MKISKKLLTLSLILSLAITGCGAKDENSNAPTPTSAKEAESTAVPTVEPQQAAAGEDGNQGGETVYPINVTDSIGNTITIKEEPKTIISFAPNLTELIYALNLSDKLIGRTQYCDYPAEVSSVPSVGDFYNPDIEKIVSMDPDIVAASSLWTEDIIAKFKEAGITVVVLSEDKEVAGIYEMIDLMGQIFQCQETAAALVDTMKTQIENVTNKVAGLPEKSVYYVVDFGESGDYTAGGDTFIGGLLTLAGGNNIANDVNGWMYSLESLIEADPEVIIIGESKKDDFINSGNYKNLSAVKNGKVYGIDNNLLDRQSYRTSEGIEAVAKLLHPEAFQ